MTSGVASILIDTLEGFGGVLLYVMKGYEKLYSAQICSDDFPSITSNPDNHFIDITGDDEQDKSLPIFYVLVDRHL